jgi:hypothetical protein
VSNDSNYDCYGIGLNRKHLVHTREGDFWLFIVLSPISEKWRYILVRLTFRRQAFRRTLSLATKTCISVSGSSQVDMKSSVIPADSGYPAAVNVQPSGGFESLSVPEMVVAEESPTSIPHHPLGVKPSGNQYTATSNAKRLIGPFQILPDEILAIFLEYLDSSQLRLLGSTCKFLHACCTSDDLWKALFIEYV